MTPVEERLRRRIALSGPITVAEYMAACLTEPDGYYAHHEPFGVMGDFVTAPEISQMFGELLGAWLVDRWLCDGAPNPVDLVDLGPGRGTLMADILRVAGRVPAFMEASRVVLVEASPRLRDVQRGRLANLHGRVEFAATPPTEHPLYLVANEFFDALPIRQFVRREGRWHERTVGLSDQGLAFGLSPYPAPLTAEASDGAVYEVSPAGEALAGSIAAAIAAYGSGAALIVDYGHASGSAGGETLQAVRAHSFADPLEAPGRCDLSAHVNFAALANAVRRGGAVPHGPVDQGRFLLNLGLLDRAAALGHQADATEREAITGAVERLAGHGAQQMGSLFKVLAITVEADPPTGF